MERWEKGVLAAIVGVQVILASSWWFVIDDAYISFRFSKNWADGLGPVFNPTEHPPVEGYSNFLWMAGAALVELVGADPTVVMPLVSMACGVTLALWVHRTARVELGWAPTPALLTTLGLSLSSAIVVWSTSGLATMAHALTLFVVAERLVLARGASWWIAALAGVGLVLVRTEGIAWFAVVVVLALIAAAFDPRDRRQALRGLVGTTLAVALAYGAYFAWRYQVYGTVLANTATAKVDFGRPRFERGGRYVIGYWLVAFTPLLHLLPVPTMWLAARWRGLLLASLAFGPPLYAALVGGDFMAMGRMLVPGLAFGALVMGSLWQALWVDDRRGLALVLAIGTTVLGTFPLLEVHPVPEEVRRVFRVRWNTSSFRTEAAQWRFMRGNARRWAKLGRALDQVTEPGDSLVLGPIGAVGYHTQLHLFDRYGLVSREVATLATPTDTRGRHSPGHDKEVPVTFFLDQEPTFLEAEALTGAAGLRRLEREVRSWRYGDKVKADYAPSVRTTELDGDTLHVLLLARYEDAPAVWAAWPDTVATLQGREPDLGEPDTDDDDDEGEATRER